MIHNDHAAETGYSRSELKMALGWLEMVLSCMSDGLSVFDSGYRWIFMNKVDQARIRQLGYDPLSFSGRVVWEAMPGIADTRAGQKLKEVMENRISASFEESCGGQFYEIYLSPLGDGGVAATTRDVTERKRAQEELSKSQEALRKANEELEQNVRLRTAELARTLEELKIKQEEKMKAEGAATAERRRMEHLTELLPVGIMLVSPDYHIMFENRFFRDRFGGLNDSRCCYELLFGRDQPCDSCSITEIVQTETPGYWEICDLNKHTYSLYAFPFSDTDQSPLILIIGIDITARRRAEEQLEGAHKQLAARAEQLRAMLIELSRSEERQRRSLAQVLHDELQQLLVAIKFGAEFLLHKPIEEEMKADVRRIIDLTSESIRVTRSLTAELSPPVLHEAGIVGGLKWLSRWIKEHHGLDVEVVAQEGTPRLTEEIRTMLFQSVRELLFNVVKHAGTNRAFVRVTHDKKKISTFRLRIMEKDLFSQKNLSPLPAASACSAFVNGCPF